MLRLTAERLFGCSLLAIVGIVATPQRYGYVKSDFVFGSGPPNYAGDLSERGDFSIIVTPEPIIHPTSSQTILSENTSDECICVPYYFCDPHNNTVRTDNGDFGTISVRLDDRECQAVLDVCCKNEHHKEEAIVPKPVVQKPNRAAGCGIRNVGGIDFALAGATVCK